MSTKNNIIIAASIVGVEVFFLLIIFCILIYRKYFRKPLANGQSNNPNDVNNHNININLNTNNDSQSVTDETHMGATNNNSGDHDNHHLNNHNNNISKKGISFKTGNSFREEENVGQFKTSVNESTGQSINRNKSLTNQQPQHNSSFSNNNNDNFQNNNKSILRRKSTKNQSFNQGSNDNYLQNESNDNSGNNNNYRDSVKLRDPARIIFETGWRRTTSAANLLHSGLISNEIMEALRRGSIDQEEIKNQLKGNLYGLAPISGFINMKTNETISLTSAYERNIVTKDQLILLLEAQIACGNIFDTRSGEVTPLENAIKLELIPKFTQKHLQTVEGAVYGYVDPRSNEMLSTWQALDRKLLERSLCLRILSVQIATGGIVNPFLNHRVPTNRAIINRIIDPETLNLVQKGRQEYTCFLPSGDTQDCSYDSLMNLSKKCKTTGLPLLPYYPTDHNQNNNNHTIGNKIFTGSSFHTFVQPDAMQKAIEKDTMNLRRQQILLKTPFQTSISLAELEKMRLADSHVIDSFISGKLPKEEFKLLMTPVLRGKQPIGGVIDDNSKQAFTVWNAYRAGLIKKHTATSLLEAQAACGGFVDAREFLANSNASRKIDIGRVTDAYKACRDGLFEDVKIAKKMQVVLDIVRKGITWTPQNKGGMQETMPLYEALSKGYTPDQQMLRILDSQLSTGGFLMPEKMIRVPLQKARELKLIDEKTDQLLTDPQIHEKAFQDPNLGKTQTYTELLDLCHVDQKSGLTMLILKGATNSKISIKQNGLLASTQNQNNIQMIQGQRSIHQNQSVRDNHRSMRDNQRE